MTGSNVHIIKSSGEKARFSLHKLKASLLKSGADEKTVKQILDTVRDELYQGISTKEIYNRAYSLLKKEQTVLASRYSLKKAIYQLGPTGFPFERFVSAILKYSGYKVEVGKIVPGHCVNHEIDVLAEKNESFILVECKFHSEEGRKCNVKVPLYINSRFQDVKKKWENTIPQKHLTHALVVTNTHFTKDAIQYGICADLELLSWDYPKGNALKERIDRIGLYPITVSTLLTEKEKQFLLDRNIVLCRELVKEAFMLDHLGVSEQRKEKIIREINQLCISK